MSALATERMKRCLALTVSAIVACGSLTQVFADGDDSLEPPAPSNAESARHSPDLAMAIATQGDAALRSIREEMRRSLLASMQPQLPAPGSLGAGPTPEAVELSELTH